MPKKKHILVLSSWYPENANSRNGIFILRQLEALAESGQYELGLVAAIPRFSKSEAAFSGRSGLPVEIGTYHAGKFALVQAWRYGVALWRAYRTYLKHHGKPDVLLNQVVWKAGWLALFLHYLHNLPYVVVEHWSGYLPEAKHASGFWRKYLTKLVIERAEAVGVVSAHLQQAMQQQGLSNRYVVVPNLVDTAVFKPHSELKRSVSPLFLHVSNLAPVKNFPMLLEAFALYRAHHPAAECWVAGAFDPQAARRNFDGPWEGVKLLGVLSPEALVACYQQATALLLPSQYETFSIVVPEAMCCGCGVIASDLPALREHAPFGNIAWVREFTPQAWCRAMLAFEPSPGAKAAENAQAIENAYGEKAVVARLTQLINRTQHVA